MNALPTIGEVETLTSGIEGWLSKAEGRLLYELARSADRRGCIVEIGSWKGRSTVWLASGAKAGLGARVVAIDPHRDSSLHSAGESTEHDLRRNLELAKVSDQADVVVATSEDAAVSWNRPISLLFIDGEHDYESVRRDLLLWEGHVVDGGVVALHDTLFWEGPRRVVSEFFGRMPRYSSLGYGGTITYARRTLRPTMRDRVMKRIALLDCYFYGVRVRAYADNRFGYADLQDGLVRRTGSIRHRLFHRRGSRET